MPPSTTQRPGARTGIGPKIASASTSPVTGGHPSTISPSQPFPQISAVSSLQNMGPPIKPEAFSRDAKGKYHMPQSLAETEAISLILREYSVLKYTDKQVFPIQPRCKHLGISGFRNQCFQDARRERFLEDLRPRLPRHTSFPTLHSTPQHNINLARWDIGDTCQ